MNILFLRLRFWLMVSLAGSAAGGAQGAVKLIVPAGYLPSVPVLVRVEVLGPDGRRDRDLWDADAMLTASGGVTLSTNRITLRNGLGSFLVTFANGANFTLTASVNGEQAGRNLVTLTNAPVTTLGGTLPGAGSIWSGVMRVTNDVTVPVGHTLTIASNTLVLVNGVASGTTAPDIFVNGTLQSLGTEDYPVTITCADAALRWGQIRHNNAQPSEYRFTIITRAGRAAGEGHTGQAPVIRPNGSTITFRGCSITDHAESARGAAGFGTPGKIMYAINSALVFDDCLLGRSRMGPEIQGTSLLFTNSVLLEMFGPDDSDGIYLHDQQAGQQLRLVDSVMGYGDDDGIDTLGSIVEVENCILRNWSNPNEDAKGISAFNGVVTVRRCLIVDCWVGVSGKWSSGAPAIFTMHNSTVIGISNSVAANFKANAPGPFIDFRITNCIIWGADALKTDFGPTNFTLGYCDVAESWPGTGNLSSDPLFVDAAAKNFRLLASSPCINTGDPSSPNDPDGSRADMGYYPFSGVVGSPLTVAITSPANGAAFVGPTNLTIVASAASATSTVASVEFFNGAGSLGVDASNPYSVDWSDVPLGSYTLTAVATENGGRKATSAPVNITLITGLEPTTNTLIAAGSVWKFLDDGSDQGTGWSATSFNDGTWASGPAQLGYGDGDESTLVGFGPNAQDKFVTTYFRHAFVVQNHGQYESLLLRVLRDDGAIVYLNGVELWRLSMPPDPVGYRTYSTEANEYDWIGTTLAPTALISGTNVLAVEVHQGSASSSDLTLDLELRAVAPPPTNLPPVVAFSNPAGNLTVAAPASLSLAATASDVDGSVTNMTFYANLTRLADDPSSPYGFAWNGVAAGNYALTAVARDNLGLASTSTVVSLVVSTNVAPPVVTNVFPTPGTVTNLTQVTVSFSKAVTGVDAADLRINGAPATSVSGAGASYTFAFAQPAYGAVAFTWAAGHGLTDVFTPPHAFNSGGPGATWQYQFLDVVPPTAPVIEPVPGSTVAALTSVSVTFSEPVSGVGAADLLINGAAASGVTGTGAGPYTFAFTEPSAGPVMVNWLGGHGIRDASSNSFAGGAWSYVLDPTASGVVINEIMYHPSSENPLEEFIELFNKGATPVNLAGWRFSAGVQFKFPAVTIAGGGYLAVAADVAVFTNKYPGITNVVGGWTGKLSNSREDIDLDDATGNRVDSVFFADRGDWGIRQRGVNDRGHFGWEWLAEHDGLGKSAELINVNLSNNSGQNWAASRATNGTPGRVNTVLSNNLPPMILQAVHFPLVPKSTEAVLVTARIVDESGPGVTVSLFHRVDSLTQTAFTNLTLRDDGVAGDGVAGDGLYSALIPAQPVGTVVEFYLSATDPQGLTRTWPGPAVDQGGASLGQVANLLYQVDDGSYSATTPLYKFILREAERAELTQIGDGAYPGESQSDAQMNGTFIAIDGTGADVRYRVGIRNRGHGSRNRNPNNYRVNFPTDQPWKAIVALNINGQYSWVQQVGAVLSLKAGVAGATARAVELRVNNGNLAFSGDGGGDSRTYGLYVANEALNDDWGDFHFRNDGGGNIYRAIRDLAPPDFNYRGPDKNAYTNTYFKSSNESEDDWTDLIAMLRVMGASDQFTVANARQVINAEQWLTHLAVMALFDSRETGLNTGNNDDYSMYRGEADSRFILLYYDLDTILGKGSTPGSTTSTLFGATGLPFFNQFMRHPEFETNYYRILQRLVTTTFSAASFDALVDQTIGHVPDSVRTTIKTWMNGRRAYVLSQIPPGLLPAAPVAVVSGTPRSPTPVSAAQFTVSGEGVTHYQFSLNNGALSAETAVATPISLNAAGGVVTGTNSLRVIGRNAAGVWQSLSESTVASWVVNPAWHRVRLNEVLARNVAALNHFSSFPDAIELYNETDVPANLSGLRLTDDPADPDKFTFTNGTMLAAGAYLVLYANNPDGSPGIHLGFSLDQDGEGVYLFDRATNGAVVLDSVAFGFQLTDRSVGRIGLSGDWVLTQPGLGAINTALPTGNPRNLRINEWLALGAGIYPDDFIEIFNPDALPVALGGLSLTDQPIGTPTQNRIPPLSFMLGASHQVFIADGDGDRADHVNFQLAGEFGEIALVAADRSIIDCVIYGPQQPGVAQGRCPDGALKPTVLEQPTSGAPNACPFVPPAPVVVEFLALSNVWRYDATGTNLGTAWKETNYNDAAWPSGPGLLGQETAVLPDLLRTGLPLSTTKTTYYFRAYFNLPTNNLSELRLSHVIDDGAVFYLNGQEVQRFGLPGGTILVTNLASFIADATLLGPFTLPLNALVAGTNVMAVEVHQNLPTSGDLVFGLKLEGVILTNTPAAAGLVINEVLANNGTLEEPDGSRPDWVELFNPSLNTVDIADMSLSDALTAPRRWVLPVGSVVPARGFLRLRFDSGRPASATNSGFGLKANGGAVFLYNRLADGGGLASSVTYGLQPADWSLGRSPDGGSNWTLTLPSLGSANLPATLGSSAALRINEWMADPASGEDWFEVFNSGPEPLALGGLRLTDDLDNRTKFTLAPLSFIGVGLNGFIRFEADNTPASGADHVNFRLAASGEDLAISTAAGALINGVSFDAQANGVSEGRLPDGATIIVPFPQTPSPGRSNFLPLGDVVVNEVLTHSDPPLEDAVEFYNRGGDDVDISGWSLSDSAANLRKYVIPSNTVVRAGGYVVVYEAQFNSDLAGEPFSFSSANGDEVYLSQVVTGQITGYRAYASFGAAENGVSFGRFLTSVGADFTAMSARTFGVDNPATTNQFETGTGATNAYPKVGPIVFSEIMYRPAVTNDALEFLELRNITATNVALFDLEHPSNTWRLRKGVDFDFPPGVSMAPGGYLVVVSFDPAANAPALSAFRGAYGSNMTLIGPYSGKLDNSGEAVELQKPDAPQLNDPSNVPYVVVEHVNYDNAAPWPAAADGTGASLQRLNLAQYGNDPVNWAAASPSPGPGANPDLDGDGMPNTWEELYGLNPNSAADALTDLDGDGVNNLNEFLSGTNPADDQDRLKILSARWEGGQVVVRFQGTAGRTYSLMARSLVHTGAWTKVADFGSQGFSGAMEITDSAPGATQRFYRVITPTPAEP